VRLVTRTSRTFELTEEGHLFYERCERIVAEIAEAEAEASSQGKTVKGKLRIGAPMEIGRRLMAPLVAGFVEKYPGIQIYLNLSDSGLDVIDDGLDIALRVGLPADASVIARKILSTRRIVCASPSYLARQGVPRRPEDPRQHDCIRLVRGRRVMDAWSFQEGGKRFDLTVSGCLTTTGGEVVHNWVRAGRGISLKAVWDVQPDLEAGTIVECLQDFGAIGSICSRFVPTAGTFSSASGSFSNILRRHSRRWFKRKAEFCKSARRASPRKVNRAKRWLDRMRGEWSDPRTGGGTGDYGRSRLELFGTIFLLGEVGISTLGDNGLWWSADASSRWRHETRAPLASW
jgi:DNA-binding transcriptional LysR family regulator